MGSEVVLYPILSDNALGFRWYWSSKDNRSRSSPFDLFFEALDDAETRGHEVNMRATFAAARTASSAWAPDARVVQVHFHLFSGASSAC